MIDTPFDKGTCLGAQFKTWIDTSCPCIRISHYVVKTIAELNDAILNIGLIVEERLLHKTTLTFPRADKPTKTVNTYGSFFLFILGHGTGRGSMDNPGYIVMQNHVQHSYIAVLSTIMNNKVLHDHLNHIHFNHCCIGDAIELDYIDSDEVLNTWLTGINGIVPGEHISKVVQCIMEKLRWWYNTNSDFPRIMNDVIREVNGMQSHGDDTAEWGLHFHY